MVVFPRKGGLYWYVADIWETFIAVPVVVVQRKRSALSHRFKVRIAGLDADGSAEYEYVVPKNELHKTYKQAQAEAAKLNARR